MITLVENGEKLADLLQQHIQQCYSHAVDPTHIVNALKLLMAHTEGVKQSLPYKVARNDYYGDELDEASYEELRELIAEVGYEEVSAVLGDGVADILSGGR
jgi:hypothetical protein